MRPTLASVVLVADLTGTLVFAAEGAMVASARHLDLFGIMVLACVVALGGGMIRDVLIGAAPPSAIRDWRYPALAFLTGLVVFLLPPAMRLAPGGRCWRCWMQRAWRCLPSRGPRRPCHVASARWDRP
ncbi:hypothetical protein GLI01_09970 [Gluconacetobacter liquefaciens]|uniref:trimeric intracellular cation channel family protein n=1 Tax=Gluconacetobacter liquefaciens TaxID=89584 RepID=UPI00117171DB|nr:TRIC cation channel family protein [Gluconacetobacter liquefaciens]GBR03948.1 hypothetical protein AA0522_1820 [Gluconacetobacter liquefaciens NRIC 0522]GEB36962.1 hypothetical protein GLI01_09970 [Gluconacetobacter liquefaciens]